MAKTTEERRAANRVKIMSELDAVPMLDADLEHLMKLTACDFSGNMQVLQNAFGALCIGRLYGWRVLRLALDKDTYSKYQKMLGVKFAECCPDRGVLADRSIALNISDELGKFWDLVRGTLPGRGAKIKELVES